MTSHTQTALWLLALCSTVAFAADGCEIEGAHKAFGDQWVVRNRFVQECQQTENGWSIRVVSCQLPGGEKLAIGESADGFTCSAAGGTRVEMHLPKSTANCDGKQDGEEWTDGKFTKLCEDQLVQFVGCVAPNGQKLKVGESASVDSALYTCSKSANQEQIHLQVELKAENEVSSVRKIRSAKSALCNDKAEGQEWDEGNFRLTCQDKHVEYIGCYGQDHQLIPVEGTKPIKGFVYKCEKTELGIRVFPLNDKPVKKAGPPGIAPPGFEAFAPKQDQTKGCMGHENGAEWQTASFKAKCVEGRTRWLSCLREGVEIAVGAQKAVGDFDYRCQLQAADGGVRLEPVLPADQPAAKAACDGHAEGAEWRVGNFQRACEKGQTVFRGCFRDALFIPVGETRPVGKLDYQCVHRGKGVELLPVL